jgi:flagellar protein FlgJ
MTNRVDSPAVYNDLNGLSSLKRDSKTQDSSNLREVAKQFESLFTRQMLKSMREANYGDSLLGSDQQSFYQGMYDDQLAVELSKGHGLGLADMLVKQLTQAGLVPKQADAAIPPGEKLNLSGAGVDAARSFPLNEPKHPGGMALDRAHGGMPLHREGSNAAQKALPVDTSIIKESDSFDSGNANIRASDFTAASANMTSGTAGSAVVTGTSAASWRPASKEEFIRDLWPAAQQAGAELGVDPKTLIAHAALESSWGRAMPRDSQGNASFNLFGIKATNQWVGKASVNHTVEVENGVAVSRREKFRHYDSPVDSFKDYVALLRNNPRYAEALNTGSDAKAFATALQKGGYATDPAYAQKVASIARNMSSDATALKYAANLPITSSTRTL